MEKWQLFGEYFTKGVFFTAAKWLLIALAFNFAINKARDFFSLGLDDTDASGTKRSGMKLLVDHKTGVQYLSDGKGGMVVRVDALGKPVIEGK